MALHWRMLLILFLVRLAMGYEFQTIASSSGQLVDQFGLTYAEIGALIGFFLLPGIVVAVPSGLMTRALADKKLVIIGAAAMIVGSLTMGLGQSIDALYAGRLMTGIGGTIFNVVLTKMVTDWFAGRRIVFALAVMLAAWPGGIAAGLLTQGSIAGTWGWPWAMHAASLLAALALALTAAVYRDAPTPGASADPLRFLLPLRELAHMSVVGINWALFNATLIVIVSFTPDHLIANGYIPADARAVTSVILWVSLVVIPLGGKVVEAAGRTTAAITVAMTAGGLLILALEQVMAPGLVIALAAVSMSIPCGALMALSAEAVRPVNRGPGLGIFYTWYYIGMAFAPALAGWSGDVTADTGAPLIMSAAMGFTVVGITILLRLMQRVWPIPAD